MTKKHSLPAGARYSLVDKNVNIVGGVYTTPDEVMRWARKIPRGTPLVELVVIDPDAPENLANP